MNRRYVTIPEIREIMERYNKILAPEEKLKFHVVTDHSYFTPRMKECHNVIVGKNVRFISFAFSRDFLMSVLKNTGALRMNYDLLDWGYTYPE